MSEKLPLDPTLTPPPRLAAGTLAMSLFLASLGMLFAASLMAYLIVRVRSEQWVPDGAPHLPGLMWLSTLVILSASVTIHRAVVAVRADAQRKLMINMTITLILGILFLGLQTWNWAEIFAGTTLPQTRRNLYLFTFFVLTGLHAAHVLGGIIPLAVTLHKARAGTYNANYYPGIRYSAMYWHFLDATWVVVFAALLIGS